MDAHSVFGFIGDGVTFLSGLLLAWDAVVAEDEFVRFDAIVKGLKNPAMENVRVKIGDRVVENEKDVERVFRRKASKKALTGCVGLAIGFGCLLASRILEVLSH